MPIATSRVASTALQVPPTQNTAPVIEFNCLYTHDIKRKAKRWQDGFLRLHTFNSRAMVYDEQRNLVGDTHLTDTKDLSDGDEIRLEKVGVLVQVADRKGETRTDLTGVCKTRTTANPASSSPLRLPEINTIPRNDRLPLQERHRSLNAMLGAGRKPIGKAVLPARSPFELRQEAENWADRDSVKRRRISREHDRPSRHHHDGSLAAKGGQKDGDKTTRHTSVAQIDLTEDDHPERLYSSIVPTPPTPATVMPCSRTAARPSADATARQEPNGKRLYIASRSAKRNTLACQAVIHPKTIEEKQRQRVTERLAKYDNRAAASGRRDTPNLVPPVKPDVANRHSIQSRVRHESMKVMQRGKRGAEQQTEAVAVTVHKATFDDMDTMEDDIDALLQAETDLAAPIVAVGADEDAITTTCQQADTAVAEINDTEDLDDAFFDLDDELERLATSSTLAAEDVGSDMHLALPDDVAGMDQIGVADPAIADIVPLVAAETQDMQTLLNTESLVIDADEEMVDVDLEARQVVNECEDSPKHEATPEPLAQSAGEHVFGTDAVSKPSSGPVAPRRSKRVGRQEIRKSAAACFKPPTLTTRVSSGPHQLPTDTPSVLSTISNGPWSREAFDLFTWRPPGWNESRWCVDAGSS